MTAENFKVFMQHFVDVITCNQENKVLLILDNHESYTVLKYCKENGVQLLTLPPHCSHRLQPLDVTCFGPFKTY